MPIDIPPGVKEAVNDLTPGAIGSAIAAVFMKGTPWPQRLAMVVGGMAIARYCAVPIAKYMNEPEWTGAIGLLLGLFAMGLIRKGWEAIDKFSGGDVARTAMDAIRKFLGLPPLPPPGDKNG